MEEGIWKRLTKTVRRKEFSHYQLEHGNLKRCLSYWDLVGLGLGGSLGIGVFVLLGSVGLNVAGPSVILSFLIAAVAALFAGLCYAELSARVPRAGSAYIYSYVTVGEVVAFIVGWNMIFEGLFGAASIARGLSSFVDSLSNGTMSSWYQTSMPLSTGVYFSTHFDMLAFIIVLALGVLLAAGVKESTRVNTVFTAITMAVILFIIITGAIKANLSNWYIQISDVPSPQYGNGGFFPYGVWGTLEGAAICFYGFVGFDVISASSEEAHQPRRNIPKAIITVLSVAFLVYGAVAIVITMMVPYYALDSLYAVPQAFSHHGMNWAMWIVSVGAIFAISSCLFGAMFPLPRLLYAMSSDGLLLRCLSRLTSKKSPVLATLVSACVIALLAAMVELKQLILMVCTGTLLSYTIVSACVIVLRYSSKNMPHVSKSYFKQIFGCGPRVPSNVTSKVVGITLLLFIGVCITTAAVAVYVAQPLIPVVTLNTVALLLLVVMMLQPQKKDELEFKTPLVPLIPCLSIYINIHLMILINVQTWIRVGIWILIGIPVYLLCLCCYKPNQKDNQVDVKNGPHTVQIIVESPTPTGTMKSSSTYYGGEQMMKKNDMEMQEKRNSKYFMTEDIIMQQVILEDNEEREAKIIDLLDQVLQAEEESYAEVTSLNEGKEDTETKSNDPISHRKSFSDLSDAGSDASLGNPVLSKYDVVVQVHREDLPRVSEEEEKSDKESEEIQNDEQTINDLFEKSDEIVTAFNIDSETNSQTDESGYSDTIDRHTLNYSTEETSQKEDAPNIPIPPPLDESFFTDSYFLKSYTIPLPAKQKSSEDEEERKPRESVKSNSSQDDSTIVFGSSRQMSFMSKLNNIFQNKMINPEEKQQMKRSNSTGDVIDTATFTMNRGRPSIFNDLNKELLSLNSTPQLRTVKTKDDEARNKIDTDDEKDDSTLSREDLKSKLENILAAGGPKLMKTRTMQSNPPTPEEAYQTDTSSSESIQKLPKIEKNDTLKRQKEKFSAVLNSFRLSLNLDDEF